MRVIFSILGLSLCRLDNTTQRQTKETPTQDTRLILSKLEDIRNEFKSQSQSEMKLGNDAEQTALPYPTEVEFNSEVVERLQRLSKMVITLRALLEINNVKISNSLNDEISKLANYKISK